MILEKKRLIQAMIISLSVFGGLFFYSSAAAVVDLKPNLVALDAEDIRLTTVGPSTILRFSTVSWNNGAGAVEIEGGATTTGGKQRVYQNIYQDDGSIRQRIAGEFLYHDEHSHIHFEGYANYTLQPVDASGASERYGQKTSFCLMDTTRVNHKLSGAPKKAEYDTCSSGIQGISVGWGDKYGYQLAGQEIDVTELPEGDYNLIIDVNPLGRLEESDMTDNISVVLVRFENGNVSVVGDGSSEGPGNSNRRGGGRPL